MAFNSVEGPIETDAGAPGSATTLAMTTLQEQGLVIIEDFYDDPDGIRHEALHAKYHQPEFPYPWHLSTRPSAVIAEVYGTIERVLGEKLYDYAVAAPRSSIGRFALGLRGANPIICIHSDPFMWAGIVYLHPKPPDLSGTRFFGHVPTGRRHRSIEEERKDLRSMVPLNIVQPDCFDEYETVRRVENRYNRLVLFDATQYHATERFFGRTGVDGRLTQNLFFNTKRSFR